MNSRQLLLSSILGGLLGLSLSAAPARAQQSVIISGYDLTSFPDGGIIRKVQVDSAGRFSSGAPFVCTNAVQAVYLMDAGPITIGQATARSYTVLCNSRDNSTGTIRCRADDGGVPAVTVGSVGDALSPGDCINYTNPVSKPIKCIGASTYLTSFECVP